MYKLSREMYRDIKKRMDANDIAQLLTNVFNEGYKAATNNTQSITLEDLHNAICEVKGIGDKRMSEIDEKIKELFEKRGS